jgi:hypothetical protein
MVAVKDKAMEGIRSLPILETRAEHLLRAMEKGLNEHLPQADSQFRHRHELASVSRDPKAHVARFPF